MKSPTTPPVPEPLFLSLSRGRRFCVRYAPQSAARGAMLFVPPFAEEMNKSRRMVALAARGLCEAGWIVVIPDLYGCGDSEGAFADADWAQWCADVRAIAQWLGEASGHRPVWWAMRAGCLLACDAVRQMSATVDFVFWQPQLSGRQALKQFLRQRVAQDAVDANSTTRATTEGLREFLLRGQTLEVGGYELPPGVALGLDDAQLTLPDRRARVAWFEIVGAQTAGASPAVHAHVDAWRASGHEASLREIAGEAFWQTQEIAECPALVDATRAAVAGWQT